MNTLPADVREIIQQLKEISDSISKEKVWQILHGDKIDRYKEVDALDYRQSMQVHKVLSDAGITDSTQFFLSHNLMFFYGLEGTSLGTVSHMLLYDVESIKPRSLTMYGNTTTFDWIRVGKKHFHGVLDFGGFEKTGALSLPEGRVVFFDDDENIKQDILEALRSIEGVSLQDCDFKTLYRTQWGSLEDAIRTDCIVKDYEESLLIHEGTHQLLNDILDVEMHNFLPDYKSQKIYDKESEKFAYLAQMALGPLPAYTLLQAFCSMNSDDGYATQYAVAVKGILTHFIAIIHDRPDLFDGSNVKWVRSGEYTLPDLARLVGSFTSDQIRFLAKVTCDTLYEPLVLERDNWERWAVDYDTEKIVLWDGNGKKIASL